MNEPNDLPTDDSLSRRQLLCATAAGAATLSGLAVTETEAAQARVALNGRIRQSVVFWCFNSAGEKWNIERTCRAAVELGCPSVEIVPPEDWGVLRKHKLICAIAP